MSNLTESTNKTFLKDFLEGLFKTTSTLLRADLPISARNYVACQMAFTRNYLKKGTVGNYYYYRYGSNLSPKVLHYAMRACQSCSSAVTKYEADMNIRMSGITPPDSLDWESDMSTWKEEHMDHLLALALIA